VTPQAPLTGSGCREYSYGGFGGGHPHFHPHTVSRALLAGFKARASFGFTGCWWRSLAIDRQSVWAPDIEVWKPEHCHNGAREGILASWRIQASLPPANRPTFYAILSTSRKGGGILFPWTTTNRV